ncbi:MAG: hypothetical protein B7X35_02490 [Halothiobacillus sp. 14-56-357]|jgi:hypothetical protein|nr:MAG: hypothetical protein B7X35_02490 [Halothiobacillus sp. 14-56-357]OZB79599.1 MAG: hypothetical protein B7X29_00060 [Halothiobacillus sp. 13-55-115]
MSAIPFTDRELTRAWRELSAVATPLSGGTRQNPHRLLLFYAVECGLKAVWLKRQGRTLFEGADVSKTGHDLRQVLKDLNVGANLPLSENFRLPTVAHDQTQLTRNGKFGDLHQAWRYGGRSELPTDNDCEQQLQKVLNWIQGELK